MKNIIENFINKLREYKAVGIVKSIAENNGYSAISVDNQTTIDNFIKKVQTAILEENSIETVVITDAIEQDYGYRLLLSIDYSDDTDQYSTTLNITLATIY
jgi:hypothetical protein